MKILRQRRGGVPLAVLLAGLLVGLAPAAPTPEPAPAGGEYFVPTSDVRNRLKDGSVRVFVEFDRGEIDKPTLARMLVSIKSEFLTSILRTTDEPLQFFEGRPYLSARMTLDGVEAADELRNTLFVDGRSVPFRIEAAAELTPASSACEPMADVTAQELVEKLGALQAKLGASEEPATGEGWVVLVIDDGVDPDHQILVGEVVDGKHVEGDPVCLSPSVDPPEPTPAAGKMPSSEPNQLNHGTIVAAVASRTAPGAGLVSLSVGSGKGAAIPDVLSALDEVGCRWHTEYPNIACVVLCLSSQQVSEENHAAQMKAMRERICELWCKGIPVVVAAGNDGLSLKTAFPANIGRTVSVAMTYNSMDQRAKKSNWTKDLDLCAPGTQVALTWTDGRDPTSVSGTSIAAPFVAGAIALLRQCYPTCDAETLVEALKSSQTKISVDARGGAVKLPLLDIGGAYSYLASVSANPLAASTTLASSQVDPCEPLENGGSPCGEPETPQPDPAPTGQTTTQESPGGG